MTRSSRIGTWVSAGAAAAVLLLMVAVQVRGDTAMVIIPVDEDYSSTAYPTRTTADTAAAAVENDSLAASDSSSTCECEVASLEETFMSTGLINGTHLTLMVALPLTYMGHAKLTPGFFQLASAVMAMDHFNQRNAAIVPELQDLQDNNCPIQMDYETLHVLDTGTIESNGMKQIMSGFWQEQRPLPHAIVGPYNEIPALELSVVASTLHIPMVTHRGLDHNLLLPDKHPYVTQVNPDLYADMAFLGDYLTHTGRTDYIAVLYANNADSAIQRREVFLGVAQSLNMKHIKSFGYHSPNTPRGGSSLHPKPSNVSSAVERLKKSGFRTVVWLTPWFDYDMFPVGHAAHMNGLDRGDHFWVIGAALEIDRPLEHASRSGQGEEYVDHHPEEFFDSEDFAEMFMDEAKTFDPEDWHNGAAPTQDMMNAMFNSVKEINFMRNAAFLRPAELMDIRDPEHSAYMAEWTKLNETFINRLLELNPVDSDEYDSEWMEYMILSPLMGWVDMDKFPKGSWPPADLFAKPVPFLSSPPSGALHLYDAIMSVGIGACKAMQDMPTKTHTDNDNNGSNRRRQTEEELEEEEEEINLPIIGNNTNSSWSGELLQEGIRSAHFTGASGEVLFGDGFPGSRKGTTITYHVVNLFPTGFVGDLYSVSEIRNATDWQWYEIKPFIYAGGSTSPPELLRDPADQNYLGKGVRAAGLTLMAVALLFIFVCFMWVVVHRHHSLVVASQPLILYLLCMGCTVTSLAILFLSFDESHGWSQERLTRACKVWPWLVVFGHIWTYNCLFTKLWRVNRVLQFSRRQVNLGHVVWPALLIDSTALILLSIWTATTEMHWERTEIDEVTGESMGKCDSDDKSGFWIAIAILVMIPTILTGVFAWKTIDVDATYSEARWIFVLMLVQCQVILVAVPLVFILDEVSTDGRFLGAALILWTFPMTTMSLIMVPKMIAVHFPEGNHHQSHRGSSAGVRISGIPVSSMEDKSTRTHSHISRQSGSTPFSQSNVSRGSDGPPLTQAQVTTLTQSNRHMHVTQF